MKVVFVVGATATGKSALALEWAEKWDGAILNADSVQIYQDLVIGSAAPTEAEKSRVPHYLFADEAPPARLTAGDYSRKARETLDHLAAQKTPVVFVVGGTGFYLMALEKGMLPVEKADPLAQAQLEAELAEPDGALRLHAELTAKDPVVAARISPQDHYRLVRALETLRRTGRRLSDIEEEHRQNAEKFPYPLLKVGLREDREILRDRVMKRTRQMVEGGLIAEVQGLINRGLADWEPLQSVGYKETLAFLRADPEIPTATALIELIARNTLKLTKKQRTWFQRDPAIHWGSVQTPEALTSEVTRFLTEPLVVG